MRWLPCLWLAACALEPGRGELEAQVEAVPVAGDTFTDDAGRSFQLTTATLTLRDLLFMEPADASASLSPVGPWLPLWAAAAVAHPGHDDAGPVGGELLGSFDVDLLAPSTPLGTAVLYEGAYVGAELAYEGSVVLEGTVDGVPFAFEVTPTQALTAIDFDAELTAADAPTLEVRIDIAWALSYVDWDAGDADGDGVITIEDADDGSLLVFGLHSNEGYEVVAR